MTTLKKRRLITLLIFVGSISLGVGLLLHFFRDNLVYFYGPSEIPSHLKPNQIIRIGGVVEKGSVKHQPNSIRVNFKVTDFHQSLIVEFEGILPDLFREGQGVVAEGVLQSPYIFKASRVLAKHDEKYVPPEVQHALDAPTKQKLQESLKRE